MTKEKKEVEYTGTSSTSKKIVIPDTVKGTDGVTYKVTSIAKNAMRGNNKMTQLTIGNNVVTIGADAFSGCKKLSTVTMGKSTGAKLKTIGKNAFLGCSKLKKVTVSSKNIKTAAKNAFKGTKGA